MFSLNLCLAGPGNGSLVLVQQSRVRTQLLFQGKEPSQAISISGVLVINSDVVFGRWVSSGTHFAALAVIGFFRRELGCWAAFFKLGGRKMVQGCQNIG